MRRGPRPAHYTRLDAAACDDFIDHDHPSPEPLSDADYDSRARATLARIEATIDRRLQDDVIDIDAQRTGGLLELSFPAGSKIVINTQPPLHELWLAARVGRLPLQVVGRALDRHARRRRVLRRALGLRQRAGGKALRFEP